MKIDYLPGNYIYLPGGAPYSSGVRAMPGYELMHMTLMRPLPLTEGIAAVVQYLAEIGRPPQALCGIELRCPQPYTFAGFAAFNEEYRALLQRYNMLSDGPNPIARTNIAPVTDIPRQQVIHALTYTIPAAYRASRASFVISGAGELMEASLDAAAIVRPGEISEDALREKASLVMDVMQSRLDDLELDWSQVTCINIYTVHNLTAFLRHTILDRMGGASRFGVHWYLSRPPVEDIEFEMDLRGLIHERYEDIV